MYTSLGTPPAAPLPFREHLVGVAQRTAPSQIYPLIMIVDESHRVNPPTVAHREAALEKKWISMSTQKQTASVKKLFDEAKSSFPNKPWISLTGLPGVDPRQVSLHVKAIKGLTKAEKNELASNLSSEPLDEWKKSNFNIKSISSESGIPPAFHQALQHFHNIKDVGKNPSLPLWVKMRVPPTRAAAERRGSNVSGREDLNELAQLRG